jgi:hypothetical protein
MIYLETAVQGLNWARPCLLTASVILEMILAESGRSSAGEHEEASAHMHKMTVFYPRRSFQI